jgi:hypothetical protein
MFDVKKDNGRAIINLRGKLVSKHLCQKKKFKNQTYKFRIVVTRAQGSRAPSKHYQSGNRLVQCGSK